MRLLLTALIFLGGILFTVMGIGFLVDPAASGADFGLAANGNHGLASLRADMPAFFLVAAVAMMVGAWRRNGDLLLVPAGLMGIALVGRIVSLVLDGPWDRFWEPMLVEGVTVIVLLVASRVLPHPQT